MAPSLSLEISEINFGVPKIWKLSKTKKVAFGKMLRKRNSWHHNFLSRLEIKRERDKLVSSKYRNRLKLKRERLVKCYENVIHGTIIF